MKTLLSLAALCTLILTSSAQANSVYHSLKQTALDYELIDQETLKNNLQVYELLAKDFIVKADQFSKLNPSDAQQRFSVRLDLLKLVSKSKRRIDAQIASIPGNRFLPTGRITDRFAVISNLVQTDQVVAAKIEVQKELANIRELQKD